MYLRPGRYTPERTRRQLATSSLWFSLTTVLSFLGLVAVPFLTAGGADGRSQKEGFLASCVFYGLTYVIAAVPFVFSGIAVCLALTRFPARIGKLYAFDLLGAAVGCVLLLVVMRFTDDGPREWRA